MSQVVPGIPVVKIIMTFQATMGTPEKLFCLLDFMQLTFYDIFHLTTTADAFLSTFAATQMSGCLAVCLSVFTTLTVGLTAHILHIIPSSWLKDSAYSLPYSQLVCAELSAGCLRLVLSFFSGS